MFFRNEDFPLTSALENAFPRINAEFKALAPGRFAPWPDEGLYEGKWNQFPFWIPGKRFDANCEKCPETMRMLATSLPDCTMASLAMLEPKAHIKPHCGFSHAILRAHLALRIPEGECWLRVADEKRSWEEGKAFVFDDMNEHEAYNGTDKMRIVLMLDFPRPWNFRTSVIGHIRQRWSLKRQMLAHWARVDKFHKANDDQG